MESFRIWNISVGTYQGLCRFRNYFMTLKQKQIRIYQYVYVWNYFPIEKCGTPLAGDLQDFDSQFK